MTDGQQYSGIQVVGSISSSTADETICSWTVPLNTTARIETLCILQDIDSSTQASYKLVANVARQNGYNSENAHFITVAAKVNELGATNGFEAVLGVSGSTVLAKTASVDGHEYRVACYMNIYAVEQFIDKYSVLFDGTNEYVTMGNVYGFERTSSFSFSFWAKWTGSTYYVFLGKQNTSQRGYAIATTASGQIEVGILNTWPTKLIYLRTTQDGFNDNSWHNIIVTYNGSSTAAGVLIYVDGVAYDKTVVYDNLSATILNTVGFYLGARANGDPDYFVGNMDEVSVYSKTLSSIEVKEIYNAGTPTNLSILSSSTNLIGWWRLGDGDTHPTVIDNSTDYIFPNIPDITSNAYNGMATNMEVSDIVFNAPYGKCCVFDGSNEYVNMGQVFSFEYNVSFSFSLWIKYTSAVYSHIFAKMNNTSPYWRGYQLTTTTGQLSVDMTTSSGQGIHAGTAAAFNDDKWHHIVFTYNGSGVAAGMQFYADGVPVTTNHAYDNLASRTIISIKDFNIARRADGMYFPGSIDEFAVWNKALSAVEVAEIYANGYLPVNLNEVSCSANLLAWLSMGEGNTHPTLTDRSGNGYNGTMVNMEADDIQDRDFDFNKASSKYSMVLGGTNEYINMGNVLDQNSDSVFSISCWTKSSYSATNQYLVSKFFDPATAIGWGVRFTITTGAIEMLLYNSALYQATVQTTATGYNNGAWHHVAVTIDGSATAAGIHIYVDGVDKALTVVKDNLTGYEISNPGSLNFGTRSNGSSGFYLVGSITDVSIWNKELSSTEVISIYNLGVPSDLTGSTNLVGYWRLGEGVGFNGTMTNMEAGDIVADTPR